MTARLLRWATLAALLVAWQLWGPNSDFVAAPSRIVRIGLAAVLKPEPLALVAHTTWRFLVAFAIVAVLGTVIGLLAGRLRRPLYLGGRDLTTVLYALPMAPFYPLFVLWLGLGNGSEIAFGVIHGILPVILLTMIASAGVDRSLLDSGEAMGASRVQRMLHLVVPACLPDIIGALKLGAALTLLGVLLAELMISVNGVGSFLSAQISNHRAAALDAMVVLVCLGALVVNFALSQLEHRASRWRRVEA
jgi:NitT/TauT family transport system permease protein